MSKLLSTTNIFIENGNISRLCGSAHNGFFTTNNKSCVQITIYLTNFFCSIYLDNLYLLLIRFVFSVCPRKSSFRRWGDRNKSQINEKKRHEITFFFCLSVFM